MSLSETQSAIIKRLKEGDSLLRFGRVYLIQRQGHRSCDKVSSATIKALVKRKMIQADELKIRYTLEKK